MSSAYPFSHAIANHCLLRMLQVKVLYVRNLMLTTTEVQILDAFSVYGLVERVKKIKDYAFVHFQSREDAHKAMETMNGEFSYLRVELCLPINKTFIP